MKKLKNKKDLKKIILKLKLRLASSEDNSVSEDSYSEQFKDSQMLPRQSNPSQEEEISESDKLKGQHSVAGGLSSPSQSML